MSEEKYDVLAEWTIRRLRPLEDIPDENRAEEIKRWVLYSIGLDKIHQDIFLHLEEHYRSTTTDIAKEFEISPNTARKYLDELHTVGLVDYIGREYTLTYNSLSRAIELMLIPRITDALKTIARGATTSDFTPSMFVMGDSGDDVITEEGVSLLNQKLLDIWVRRGKKVRMENLGVLEISKDVDFQALDRIIDSIFVKGILKIPEEFYHEMAHKIRSMGQVETY
jgi:DNA-binding transcriptional regulator YhcF (GntR family)